MLNAVKHLANVYCKVPARDPSSLRSVRMTPTLNLFLSDYSFIIAIMGYDFNTKHYTLNITQSRHHHPSSLGTVSFGAILLHAQGGEGLVLRL